MLQMSSQFNERLMSVPRKEGKGLIEVYNTSSSVLRSYGDIQRGGAAWKQRDVPG